MRLASQLLQLSWRLRFTEKPIYSCALQPAAAMRTWAAPLTNIAECSVLLCAAQTVDTPLRTPCDLQCGAVPLRDLSHAREKMTAPPDPTAAERTRLCMQGATQVAMPANRSVVPESEAENQRLALGASAPYCLYLLPTRGGDSAGSSWTAARRQLMHPMFGKWFAWDPYYAGVPYKTYEIIDGNKATGQVWIPATDTAEVRAYVLAFMGLFMRDRDSPYVYVRRWA